MVSAGLDGSHDLRFCDLGPLAVWIDGTERSPGGRRPAAALALLLMNVNRRVSADALREAMWGETTVDHASSTLETHIFRLRRVVEPGRRAGEAPVVVISEPGGYRLVVAPDQVDSIRFAQLSADAVELLRTGQAERARRKCEEALGLWRGLPFEPLVDEVWAAAAVSRLQQVHAQLLESYMEALLECGEPERVLRDLEPILAEFPLRERLWVHRMLAAYRCGQVDNALAAYQLARRHFRDDLGIEPGPELRELQAAILAGDESRLGRRSAPQPAPSAPDVSVNLPRRTGALFGREDEMDRVRELCTTAPLVTITGAGGCGKTRLAVEAARAMADEFVDGVWFVDLTTVQDDDQVADAVVSALGLAPATTGRTVDTVRMFVRDRRMLLVLDNCEHVLDGAADLVDALLVPGSELAVLATSRESLQVAGEVIFVLGPLSVPALGYSPVDDPEEVASSPAVQLFLERSGSQLDVADRADKLAMVAQICRSVDGVPLAVNLAAARARAYSLAEIARQVAGDPAALKQVVRGAPAHQQSVGLAVEWSHRMMTATEQLVHRRLSTVSGPFTTAAAGQMCGLSAGEMESVLADLVHKSMVVPLGPAREDGPSQFAQLATIRAHGKHELSTHREADAAGRLRTQWVADLIASKPPAGHHDERRWFNALEDDLASVRSTLHETLRDRPDPVGCFIAGRLTMFWYFRGLIPEGGRWFALAREVPGVSSFDRALVTFGLAGERALAQRMDVAAPLIQEGLRIGADRTREQDVEFAETLLHIAGGAMLGRDQRLAADLARQALQIAEQHDDEQLALTARARLAMNPDDDAADSAPELYRQAIELENHYAAYLAANGAMTRAQTLGDPAAGLRWSDKIIEVNRRQNIGQAPVVLEIRANLLVLVGEPVKALRLYSAARLHNARAGVPWPSRDGTAELLARATDQVDRTQFEDAWQAGRNLTLADMAPLTADRSSIVN